MSYLEEKETYLEIMPFPDYYQCLGVDPTASPETIKKAYHQLALTPHPGQSRGR